ncbi:T-cell immunomodulatory protein-like [Ptychodera flava]|uniref:T-cell immunomodulatory protein-like n=1 Tax=Ptychodera flava TaxID=63121 RepID=UPI003969DC3D
MDHVVNIAIFLLLSIFVTTRGTQIIPGTTPSFKDITSSVFQGSADGVVAAYGDFNNDKKPDVFVITEQGHKVNLWMWVETSKTVPGSSPSVLQKSDKVVISTKTNDSVVTSVVPGDYNGDSMMDLLITTKPNNKAKDLSVPTSAFIYWGNYLTLSIDPDPTVVSEDLYDQPHVMDFNADMIPDLFGATSNGDRYFWTGNSTDRKAIGPIPFNSVTNITTGSTLLKLRKPHSHSFVDMNGDFGADLLVTAADDSGVPKYESWFNVKGNLKWDGAHLPDLPIANPAHVGQSVFVDMDMNGKMDHVVPLCEDEKCTSSSIYVKPFGQKEWVLLAKEFKGAGSSWGFIPPEDNSLVTSTVPIMLWVGDYTLDGYMDAMAIMRNGTDSKASKKIILLENIACTSSDADVCQQGGRTFRVDIEEGIMNIDNPVLTSFCDFYDDGALDIIVTTMTGPNTQPLIHALQNNLHEDASFVKVNVLSGLCFGDCPNGIEPYGVNQPGPMIRYQTTDPDGNQQFCAAGQLSQSAYFSLQQPFVLMGLGQTPNFIDYLTVGIPFTDTPKKHTWTQLIPNSQLIAIPYPPDDPSKWTSKLLVRPSPLIYMTAGVLGATMLFIGAVVGILHWREKREDKEEKRQESHRFHFDAM